MLGFEFGVLHLMMAELLIACNQDSNVGILPSAYRKKYVYIKSTIVLQEIVKYL